ncbi:MAG: rRNA maturation RNase YbeY [Minisyncoccia bacterium]
MANKVFVFGAGEYGKEAKEIKSLGVCLFKVSKEKKIAFEVCLISNRAMRGLNRRFLKKDRATNVLSFEAAKGTLRPDLGKNTRYLGEIFLAPDFIRAKGENIGFLFIHGFLHLLGYTHEEKRDRIRMKKREDFLSRRLKINFYV